jgi:hypothetical protein
MIRSLDVLPFVCANSVFSCFFSFVRVVCAGFDATTQAALRFLWSSAKVGSTKFSPTRGVDYYASLFAFELVALFMCAYLHLGHSPIAARAFAF